MCAHFGIYGTKGVHFADGADHCRVIAVAEGAAELGKAALEPLFAEVHGYVPSERNALVPILREKVCGTQLEVVAHEPLNILHARLVGSRRTGQSNLRAGKRELHWLL